MDAVVTVLNGKVKYFHNISKNANHWILLKLIGKKSNRMALGAQIRITGEDGAKQYNEVTTAVGYACASDSRVHFGLGASKRSARSILSGPAASTRCCTTWRGSDSGD
jgi:enediyne biosynthesis protein E4